SGTYEIQIDDDKHFIFEKNGDEGGSVKAFLIMLNVSGEEETVPKIRFERKNNSSSDNVYIELGEQSLFSYAAENPIGDLTTEFGCILFDPTNDDAGRMILSLEDQSGFIIAGHKVVNPLGNSELLLTDFDLSIPTGTSAICEIFNQNTASNATTHAGLLVLNANATWTNLLFDPWCDLGARTDEEDYNGSFDGIRWGFVLGANAGMHILENSYLDYVGLANNVCPTPDNVDTSSIKARNPSAFIIDGNNNPAALQAMINLAVRSALVFRSGINKDGEIENDFLASHPYAVDPLNKTLGAGEIVFDVEGSLLVQGPDGGPAEDPSKLEILSLEVAHTGGSVLIGGSETIFPQRTFALDGDSIYYCYNKAQFFLNNSVIARNTNLVHTDTNHHVFEKNDITSEPAYTGGDTAILKDLIKPKLVLYNSRIFVHDDIAFTGFDLLVPIVPNLVEEEACFDNNSSILFFHNGKAIDHGTGRQFVLGTQIGSLACDGCTVICRDAHLDVMQIQDCDENEEAVHQLKFFSAPNDSTIVENVAEGIEEQYSIHTIYLGHASNITIGSVPAEVEFSLTSHPALILCGNYFSFETRGGTIGVPETSHLTGKGAIFIDSDGTFSIAPKFRANIATMVVKSGSAVVDLPKNRVFFDNRIGIVDWHLNLGDESKQVIDDDEIICVPLVQTGECISDYTLDWKYTEKDYNIFCPYEVGCYDPCDCPAVTTENVSGLPTILGTVEQLQIKGSRIGDAAHIKINCGHVRELVFLEGPYSAEAPTAVVVLKNHGIVGLGSLHKNIDSLGASMMLGVNGVTIIADGNGQVDLNEDLIINNICSILKGPHFGNGGEDLDEEFVLRFHSDCCRTIRVKKDGILDLSSFTYPNEIVEFAGNIKLILEPGAKVIWGGTAPINQVSLPGGTLRFIDEACLIAEPVSKLDTIFTVVPHGEHDDELSMNTIEDSTQPHHPFGGHLDIGICSTDLVRVKFLGKGFLDLAGCSCFFIDNNAFVGVETLNPEHDPNGCEILCTALCISVRDRAKFNIGSGCATVGGVFQVGNTHFHDEEGADIQFKLVIAGHDACFEIGAQGMMGLGVAIAEKLTPYPDGWLVDAAFNVSVISIQVMNGKFAHRQLYSGDDERASLLAFGPGNLSDIEFEFICLPIFDPVTANVSVSRVLGGGNTVQIIDNGLGSIHPFVDDIEGQVHPRLWSTILASKPLMVPPFVGSSAQNLFDFLRTHDIDLPSPTSGRVNAAPSDLANTIRLGYVDDGFIARLYHVLIFPGSIGTTLNHEHAIAIGAASALAGAGGPPKPLVMVMALP
ncbi:MAG: hypothetical protein WBQ73_02675, partial [Candidatus Babeliales bacterium]